MKLRKHVLGEMGALRRMKIVALSCLGLTVQIELKISPFPPSLLNNVLVVIVTQAAAKFLIIHLWLILAYPPATGYLNKISDF